MQTVGETIDTILAELNSDILTTEFTTCACGNEFKQLQVKGIPTINVCPSCYEQDERNKLHCPICDRIMNRYLKANQHGGTGEVIYLCQSCQPDISKNERLIIWENLAPLQYRTINPSLLPIPDYLKRVCEISLSDKLGILLAGTPQQGKTRIIFQRIKDDIINGKRCRVFLPGSFENDISRFASDSIAELQRYISSLNTYDVILFDDVGKGRLTDRVASELFAVIDSRITLGLTTYITMNESTSSLMNKINDKSLAAAMVERFKRYYHVIIVD